MKFEQIVEFLCKDDESSEYVLYAIPDDTVLLIKNDDDRWYRATCVQHIFPDSECNKHVYCFELEGMPQYPFVHVADLELPVRVYKLVAPTVV